MRIRAEKTQKTARQGGSLGEGYALKNVNYFLKFGYISSDSFMIFEKSYPKS